MANYGSVRVEGLDQLARALKELPQRVARNGLRAAVYAGAKVIRDEAKLQAPVAHRGIVDLARLCLGERHQFLDRTHLQAGMHGEDVGGRICAAGAR